MVDSRRNIERIGAKELSPGTLNQTAVMSANEKLKVKIFKNLFSNNFIKKNEIKKDIKK